MGLFRRTVTEAAPSRELVETRHALGVASNNVELLAESMADLELALEDRGWMTLTAQAQQEFSLWGLKQAAQLARIMAVANPLIKRGLEIRHGYIFGSGIEIMAKTADDDIQDLNEVVQRFTEDPSNKRSFVSAGAQEMLDQALGTDGNVFLAGFTTPTNGRVQVRQIPFDQIDDIICNPDDITDPWYYKRTFSEMVLTTTGQTMPGLTRTVYYPALGYQPAPGQRFTTINGWPVAWDAPVQHTAVHRQTGWKFGIGDAYAGMAWARAYKDFLGDWATLVKALSRYAWQTQVKGSKVAKTAVKLAETPSIDPRTREPNRAGATYVSTAGESLEAVPKTGATIDSGSGQPLATMVAASFGIPVTELLGDPGTTGARAVAETLSAPTRLTMQGRQQLWNDSFSEWAKYQIDQAVISPRGGLRGSYSTDPYTGLRTVVLEGKQRPIIEIGWPNLDDDNALPQVQAIVLADQTQKVPPKVTARLLMTALGVDDIDQHLQDMEDDQGNWIDPYANPDTAPPMNPAGPTVPAPDPVPAA